MAEPCPIGTLCPRRASATLMPNRVFESRRAARRALQRKAALQSGAAPNYTPRTGLHLDPHALARQQLEAHVESTAAAAVSSLRAALAQGTARHAAASQPPDGLREALSQDPAVDVDEATAVWATVWRQEARLSAGGLTRQAKRGWTPDGRFPSASDTGFATLCERFGLEAQARRQKAWVAGTARPRRVVALANPTAHEGLAWWVARVAAGMLWVAGRDNHTALTIGTRHTTSRMYSTERSGRAVSAATSPGPCDLPRRPRPPLTGRSRAAARRCSPAATRAHERRHAPCYAIGWTAPRISSYLGSELGTEVSTCCSPATCSTSAGAAAKGPASSAPHTATGGTSPAPS
jgi:hypothetical protein